MTRAVFLDRDGVLNEVHVIDGVPHPPPRPEDVVILDGVPEALASLRDRGFLLIGVTNQPDVARGTKTLDEVEEVHRHLRARLPLDDLRVCPHDDADACRCRKPQPGMLEEAARTHGVDLVASFMVGDRWKDVEAGRRAGCRTIWIDRGYGERPPEPSPEATVHDLSEAARWILEAPV